MSKGNTKLYPNFPFKRESTKYSRVYKERNLHGIFEQFEGQISFLH